VIIHQKKNDTKKDLIDKITTIMTKKRDKENKTNNSSVATVNDKKTNLIEEIQTKLKKNMNN
jgi:hypothetical protein